MFFRWNKYRTNGIETSDAGWAARKEEEWITKNHSSKLNFSTIALEQNGKWLEVETACLWYKQHTLAIASTLIHTHTHDEYSIFRRSSSISLCLYVQFNCWWVCISLDQNQKELENKTRMWAHIAHNPSIWFRTAQCMWLVLYVTSHSHVSHLTKLFTKSTQT